MTIMTEWKTSQPPTGVEIEYYRDNGKLEKATLQSSGTFATSRGGIRQQFQRTGSDQSDAFEVTKWREVDPIA
ncbi:hypothetical protein A6U97_07975 [Agrobacterium tumefaciens]|nr:hypothetical protein A6U97_07975 [Agrobacterium tumefaciens]